MTALVLFDNLIGLISRRLLYAGLFSSPKTSASDGNPSHAGNELVAAVSRTGNRREALGGPLIYSIVLFLGTLLFFR